MSALNPGDDVLVRCQVLGVMPGGQTVIVGDPHDDNAGKFYAGIDAVIPPALPAVARFLAEHPNAASILAQGVPVLNGRGPVGSDELTAVYASLIAALTEASSTRS